MGLRAIVQDVAAGSRDAGEEVARIVVAALASDYFAITELAADLADIRDGARAAGDGPVERVAGMLEAVVRHARRQREADLVRGADADLPHRLRERAASWVGGCEPDAALDRAAAAEIEQLRRLH